MNKTPYYLLDEDKLLSNFEYYPKVIVKNGLRHKIVREAWDIDEFMQKNIL